MVELMEQKIKICDGGICKRVTVRDYENRWKDLGYKIEGYQEQEIAPDLSSMTKAELIVVLKNIGHDVDMKMKKSDLIALIMEVGE